MNLRTALRRTMRRRVLALLALIASTALGPRAVATPRAPRDRPNLICIVTDDLGYGDLGCYGQKVVQTPRIDRLAAEGLRFTNHYACHTVCRPSRLVFLTGYHTAHTAIAGARVPIN